MCSPLPSHALAGALALALASACGDDDAPSDASAPDGSAALGLDIPWLAAGAPPVAPPSFTPCPAGWRELTEDDLTFCEPYPKSGIATCGPGEAHFPGEPGCAPAGTACPAGEFADGLPDDGSVIFVREGATGGDGSRSLPYGGLAEVTWSGVGAGRTVALARGSYEGTLPIRAGARVVGACAAETIVTGPAAPIEAVVTVASSGDPAAIRDLTIRPAGHAAIVVRGSDRNLEIDGVVVEHATAYALYSTDGAGVVARGLVVSDGEPGADFGIAVVVDAGSSLTVTRAALERHRDAGAIAAGAGTSLSLADALVRDLSGGSDGRLGRAVVAESGASVVVERAVIERTWDTGVYASDPGTTLSLRSSVVRDGQSSGEGGRGVDAELGARIEVRGSRFERHRSASIVLRDPGTTVDLADVLIRDTRAEPDGTGGVGIDVTEGAHLDAARVTIVRAREAALVVEEEGSSATVSDLVTRDTLPRELNLTFGRGIAVQRQASLELTRGIVEQARDIGISGAVASTVTLTDVLVRDVRGDESNGRFGRGISVQDRGHTTLTRVVVGATREAGILAIDAPIVGQDVVVEDTVAAQCGETTCAGEGLGYGLTAIGGPVNLRGFAIRRSEVCGVFLADGSLAIGALDLERGEVTGAPIGACVQQPDYDYSRLTRDVAYRDNGTNLDATSLPVPGASSSIEE